MGLAGFFGSDAVSLLRVSQFLRGNSAAGTGVVFPASTPLTLLPPLSAALLLRRAQSAFGRLDFRGWDTELFWEQKLDREVTWAEGRPKDVAWGAGEGVAFRVLKNGRQGFASGTDVSSAGLSALLERARLSARGSAPDSARALVGPFRSSSSPSKSPRGEGAGPTLFALSERTLLTRLAKWERRALSRDRRVKKVLALSVREGVGGQAIVNTLGTAVGELWSAVSLHTEILGVAGKETETAWGALEKRAWGPLEPETLVDDVCERLLTSFGARPLRSGAWPVIFTPRAGAELVDLFSQAVRADSVQKGCSFLAGREGQPVASPEVTLVDDGTWPEGVATRRWDDEGVARRRTVVVQGGVLRDFLYDSATARRAGRSSTGNASRQDRHTPPAPGPTQFFLAAGGVSKEALYRSTPRAFVVRDMIGLHTADPISGDFSVGASGFLWRGGRAVHAVRGVTLAGNLLTLLEKIDAVAHDLQWQGAVGSPSFRVREVSIGGT